MENKADLEVENNTLFQAWEWNVPFNQKHCQRLLNALSQYNDIGITIIWLPPACKASGGANCTRYDIYGLYGLSVRVIRICLDDEIVKPVKGDVLGINDWIC